MFFNGYSNDIIRHDQQLRGFSLFVQRSRTVTSSPLLLLVTGRWSTIKR